MCATVFTALQLMAGEPLSLKDITNGTFSAKRISGMNPLEGTSDYAQISSDGRQVVKFSFKTGKPTGVIFSLSEVKGDLFFDILLLFISMKICFPSTFCSMHQC